MFKQTSHCEGQFSIYELLKLVNRQQKNYDDFFINKKKTIPFYIEYSFYI